MNNIIPQNNKNKRYLPHEIKTRIYAVQMYRNCRDISYVCRKYHISRISLWRWNNKFDGTVESLMDKSHRPHSKHPNGHTNGSIKLFNPNRNEDKIKCNIRYDVNHFLCFTSLTLIHCLKIV